MRWRNDETIRQRRQTNVFFQQPVTSTCNPVLVLFIGASTSLPSSQGIAEQHLNNKALSVLLLGLVSSPYFVEAQDVPLSIVKKVPTRTYSQLPANLEEESPTKTKNEKQSLTPKQPQQCR